MYFRVKQIEISLEGKDRKARVLLEGAEDIDPKDWIESKKAPSDEWMKNLKEGWTLLAEPIFTAPGQPGTIAAFKLKSPALPSK